MTTRIQFTFWTNYSDDTDANVQSKDVMEVAVQKVDDGYAIHVREIVEKFNEFLNAAGYNGSVTYNP